MGWLLHLIPLVLHTNLGEAQAKLDAIAAGHRTGVQLSVVTEKLNVVTDGVAESWAWSLMEPPAKGRRGYTFAHTERALVATIYLSDRMHWICDIYAEYIRTPIRINRGSKLAY